MQIEILNHVNRNSRGIEVEFFSNNEPKFSNGIHHMNPLFKAFVIVNECDVDPLLISTTYVNVHQGKELTYWKMNLSSMSMLQGEGGTQSRHTFGIVL